MWDYSFVFPNLVVLFIFIVYYFAHPRLSIKLNYSFIRILVADLLVIFIDIIASKATENAALLPHFVLRALNVAFFMLFMFRSFSFFMFTEDVLGIRRNKKRPVYIVSNVAFIGFEVFALMNLFFDTIFSISPDGAYSHAALYNLIYACAFFFIILSLSCIGCHLKRLSPVLRFSLLSFNFVLVVGYISRFIFSKYLIMNFFTLVAIIIIFFTFQNPIIYLAGKASAFNKKALYEVFEEIDEKKPPLVIGFVINNYNEMREVYSGTQMDRGITLICQYIARAYPDLMRFYLHDGRFVLVGHTSVPSENIKKELAQRFKKPWCAGSEVDIYLETKFVQLDSNLSFSNPVKVLKAIFAAQKESENFKNLNVVITDETLSMIEQNTQIKRSVEKAVESNSVEMFLQPLMDAKTYKLTGAEALARIRDEDGNLIPPAKFIPIAEKNGRINSLGEQMFEKTCKFIHDYDIKKMGLSWINVNLSPIQFLRPDLNLRFSQILEKYNIDPELIHLEITEESMIDHTLLLKQINSMRKAGFQFVLDDYGSGYSNVTRIKRCPFVNVKLDMELVRDYVKLHDKFLPTLVSAFKQMEFTVTAEGVETLEMVEDMAKIGCDFLQGFYFSKPLPAEEFARTYGSR